MELLRRCGSGAGSGSGGGAGARNTHSVCMSVYTNTLTHTHWHNHKFTLSFTSTHLPTKITNVHVDITFTHISTHTTTLPTTHLQPCNRGNVISCSGSAPALRRSEAGRQTARSPAWLACPTPGTRPQSECQHSCRHGGGGGVRVHWLSNHWSR